MDIDPLEYKRLESRAQLLGSLLLFTQAFYRLRTGRDFRLSTPVSRETHYITVARELTRVFKGEIKRLIINIPPRYAKTELAIHFTAWSMAHFPDSNYIYTSYSHSLAKKQTQTIRRIIELPHYKKVFGVELSDEVGAQDNFETKQGGSVYAAGAGGTITGRGAGIMGANRFGGAIFIDDIHKPSEVTSDTMRKSINDWYFNTLMSRLNGPDVPIIFIGQRLHEDDLAANLIKSGEWEILSLPALDIHGNALNPDMHSREELHKMEKMTPYVFSSQYQQNPQPAGGGLFRPEWFKIFEEEPDIFVTFITADTAETEKTYNDATVFSFWGIYKIKNDSYETDLYGLHWIDCREIRVEPKDLEANFLDFYSKCMQYKIKPLLAGIEKKSTGTTLVSTLKSFQGLRVIEIERTRSSGSKVTRFLDIQAMISAGYVSFTKDAGHVEMCVEHCRKITANNSHAFDDIADTLADAVELGLFQKIMFNQVAAPKMSREEKARYITGNLNSILDARSRSYGGRERIPR